MRRGVRKSAKVKKRMLPKGAPPSKKALMLKERSYAAEMSEDEWAIVMQNNDLLHGLRIIPARAPDNKLALNGIDRSFLPGTLPENGY
jgi:hypothetical protein